MKELKEVAKGLASVAIVVTAVVTSMLFGRMLGSVAGKTIVKIYE